MIAYDYIGCIKLYSRGFGVLGFWGFGVQQAVNAGDSNVVDVLDIVAHQFRGDDGFLGDRNVTGSGGYDYDHALAVLFAVAFEDDGACQRAILCFLNLSGDGGVLLLGSVARVASTLPP